MFQVSKFFPDESDDDFGELWLIKYSDGDSEHMDLSEVMCNDKNKNISYYRAKSGSRLDRLHSRLRCDVPYFGAI